MVRKRGDIRIKYLAVIVILLLFSVMDLSLGSVAIPLKDILALFSGKEVPEYVRTIIAGKRIPELITAILAGTALSVCGLQMQTLFRNPLADPYVLGISSGSGLGVSLLIMGFSSFGLSLSGTFAASIGVAAAAWAGAAGVTLIILLVSKKIRDNVTLLVFGIMLGSALSAVITLFQYLSSSASLKSYVLWTMGSLTGLDPSELWIMTLLVLTGLIISLFNIKDLNVMLMGENYAKSLGINLVRVRKRILVSATLLAGAVTAFCGPIGFIGIAVPHISRMIFKNSDHKILMPATAITGAATMVFADTLAQLPGEVMMLPVNTVSALIGVPVIIFIILKNRSI
ncbi:MAG: iron ABC transporter permease [Bacteroidales bacterium]|nr:iron ABC transporter permease [Bacteroidales bacterium]MDD3989296.1 iron ABC transporter permease [Bacteroidales bacterium]